MIHSTYANSKDLTAANLAAEWAAAQQFPGTSPAFCFGFEDGKSRQPFCPEACFADLNRMASYTIGFIAAYSTNRTALAWWNEYLRTATEPSIESDASWLRSYMGN